jgi:hypothetical protein
MTTLDAKDAGETITVGFDFAALTATPADPSVAIEVVQGTDASAASMLSGSPQIVGTKVLQRVTGGVAGNEYNLRCTAADGAGSVYVVAAVLPIQHF